LEGKDKKGGSKDPTAGKNKRGGDTAGEKVGGGAGWPWVTEGPNIPVCPGGGNRPGRENETIADVAQAVK